MVIAWLAKIGSKGNRPSRCSGDLQGLQAQAATTLLPRPPTTSLRSPTGARLGAATTLPRRLHMEPRRALQVAPGLCPQLSQYLAVEMPSKSGFGSWSELFHAGWCLQLQTLQKHSSMRCCATTCHFTSALRSRASIVCYMGVIWEGYVICHLPASAPVVYDRVKISIKMPADRAQPSDVQVAGQLQWLASLQRPGPVPRPSTPRWLLHMGLRRCGRTLTGRQIQSPGKAGAAGIHDSS